MSDLDRERLHVLADLLIDAVREHDPGAVMEEFMIVTVIAVPDEVGVAEHTVTLSTSPRRFVQEGILRAALREHDINMREPDLPPEED